MGELLCFTTAADEVEIRSVDAAELVDAAPRGILVVLVVKIWVLSIGQSSILTENRRISRKAV